MFNYIIGNLRNTGISRNSNNINSYQQGNNKYLTEIVDNEQNNTQNEVVQGISQQTIQRDMTPNPIVKRYMPVMPK